MDDAMDGLANKHNNNNITLSNCIMYASVYETARERKSLTSGHHRPPPAAIAAAIIYLFSIGT